MKCVLLTQFTLVIIGLFSTVTCHNEPAYNSVEKVCLPLPSQLTVPASDGKRRIPSCSVAIKDFGYGNLHPGPIERPDGVLPEWIDIQLAIRGQEFVNSHLFQVGLGNLMGIVASLMYPGLADVLLYTGANLDQGTGAAKRYTATMAQIILWSRNTFHANNSIENVKRSIINVGKLHSAAGHSAGQTLAQNGSLGIKDKYYGKLKIRENLWDALKKDMEPLPAKYKTFPESYLKTRNQSIPMNQLDFAVVQWSATGLLIFRPEKLLVHDFDDENMRAFAHLWAVIGYALGMDDEYNLCLQPDLQTLKKVYKDFFLEYIVPAMYNVEWQSKVLLEAVGASFVDSLVPAYQRRIVEMLQIFLRTRILTDYLDLQTPNLDRVFGATIGRLLKFGWGVGELSSRVAPKSFNRIGKTLTNLVVTRQSSNFFTDRWKTDEVISAHVFYPKLNTT